MMFRFVIFSLLALVFVACNEPPAPVKGNTAAANVSTNQKELFEVRGVVQEVKPAESQVVIKHEAIPNYMPAMTMPFDVKDTNEFAGLVPGDEVTFTMVVTPDEGWVRHIRKTGQTVNLEPQHQSVRIVRDVEPLELGDAMPNYAFTNSFGKKISLDDFKGKAYAFTFIFTRCPFPNFCPRMGKNFEEACDLIKNTPNAPDNWHLISISFDPEWDTPARLKSYSETYNPDPQKWDFVTGAMIDLDAITEQFGLYFAFDKGNYNHNLRTVVVDAAGKIQQIFIGNEWKPEELVSELLKGAKAKKAH